MGIFEIISLNQFGDVRGSLVALEYNKNIPFPIGRVYYLFDTNTNESRGFHAHKDLEQLLICVRGSCELKVESKTVNKTFKLNSPIKALYIKDLVWREMHNFSNDCVLLVLASKPYDASDYIHDYKEFKRLTDSE